jgi:hypothetical protein
MDEIEINPSIKERRFDVIKTRIKRRIFDENLFPFRNPEFVTESIPEQFVTELSLIVDSLGHNLPEKEHSYPRTWWDAFKERWFPKWAKRRWPVDYRRVKISGEIIYPDLTKEIDFPPGERWVARMHANWDTTNRPAENDFPAHDERRDEGPVVMSNAEMIKNEIVDAAKAIRPQSGLDGVFVGGEEFFRLQKALRRLELLDGPIDRLVASSPHP